MRATIHYQVTPDGPFILSSVEVSDDQPFEVLLEGVVAEMKEGASKEPEFVATGTYSPRPLHSGYVRG